MIKIGFERDLAVKVINQTLLARKQVSHLLLWI